MDGRSNFSDTFASGVEELFRRDVTDSPERWEGGSGTPGTQAVSSGVSGAINSQFGTTCSRRPYHDALGSPFDSALGGAASDNPNLSPRLRQTRQVVKGSHSSMTSPRQPSRMFQNFIDVDVMKSVTELTCKPKHKVSLKQGFLQVLLFPFYLRYWRGVISTRQWMLHTALYFAQAAACAAHYFYIKPTHISASEVYFPPLMLLFIALVVGRLPHVTPHSHSSSREKMGSLLTASSGPERFSSSSHVTTTDTTKSDPSSAAARGNAPRRQRGRKGKAGRVGENLSALSPHDSVMSGGDSGAEAAQQRRMMDHRGSTSFILKQNAYSVRNEAEEQVDSETSAESDSDMESDSDSAGSTGEGTSASETRRPTTPCRPESSKKRNSTFYPHDPDEDPMSTIETINVLLWSQSPAAVLPYAAFESPLYYGSANGTQRGRAQQSHASDADESGCERSPSRRERMEQRPQRSTSSPTAGGSKRPVPFKVPMTVIGIRRCILACVEQASRSVPPTAHAESVPVIASLAFALFPSLYRVLVNVEYVQELFMTQLSNMGLFQQVGAADVAGCCSVWPCVQASAVLYGGVEAVCQMGCALAEVDPVSCVRAVEVPVGMVQSLFCVLLEVFVVAINPASNEATAKATQGHHQHQHQHAGRGHRAGGQRHNSTARAAQEGHLSCTEACQLWVSVFVVVVTAINVYILVRTVVAQLSRAETTYGKRYLYAKYFSAITSLRRSQRYNLPHFRLKNVQNVMAWLSLRGSRAWLRHEHLEVAADSVVSVTFQLFLFVVAVIGMMVIQESGGRPKNSVKVENFSEVFHGQIFLLTLVVSYYLLHFMMAGTSINHKYGNASLLLTEQLNIHLRIVVVSDRCAENGSDAKLKVKKEKLVLTSKVLELAAKLLKELEGPNKISGLSMNPQLYNITRVMVLSCLSAAISHVLGFSPKLWKL